ncbi:MAG TPA: Wzz/FepE/Etk N-terminal domain-containing protein [Terracidiphilus sp.]|nr:Wzz/FepE/Etk N-terminal domain-containing protein [Terracidiphilus sp.]
MLGHRELSVEDYLDILRRRGVLIACCAVGLLGVGVGLSYVLQPTYESQTLILIQQQTVPENYVKPVVDQNLDARLASMSEQILSRSRLEPIINRYNLFAGDGNNMDDRIAMTRKAIKVKPIHSAEAHGGMPGFSVSFDAHDARTAQLVCGEITSQFVSENLSARQQSAEGTTDFLKQQLSDAKATLDAQDAKLAAFQTKYLGRLPDQENSNTNALQALTTQLDATTQSISQMQQNETFLQTMIAQQTHETQTVGTPAAIQQDERQKQLQDLKDQKKQLDALYTPDYPDVVDVSRRIADLEAEIKSSPAQAPAPAPMKTAPVGQMDSPQLRQLRAQLHAVQQSLIPARQEQARIQQQIRMYESRIEQSPVVEEEYKKITRDHDTALKFYNSLLTKMNESSMATALEQRQQGEQFSVMDPPNLPDAPKFPNHVMFGGGGAMAGLVLGLLLTGLLEYRDTSLRTETDIWTFTKMPTLAVISHVNGLPGTPGHRSGKRRFFSRKHEPREAA